MQVHWSSHVSSCFHTGCDKLPSPPHIRSKYARVEALQAFATRQDCQSLEGLTQHLLAGQTHQLRLSDLSPVKIWSIGISCSGKGQSIMIAIGGATESLYSTPGTMDLVLQRRTGFVRVALQTGAALVPVINFGENELYNTVRGSSNSALRRFQMCAIPSAFAHRHDQIMLILVLSMCVACLPCLPVACMFVRLPVACLSVCLSVCLPACLPASLRLPSVCPPLFLSVCSSLIPQLAHTTSKA